MDRNRHLKLRQVAERHQQLVVLFRQLHASGARMVEPGGPLAMGGKIGDLSPDGDWFEVRFAGSTLRFQFFLATSTGPTKGKIVCCRMDPLEERPPQELG